MTYEIEGWVEVTWCHGSEQEEDEDYAWQTVIDLSSLVRPSLVSEGLFGLSKRHTSSAEPPDALAARRGVPANPSQRVREYREATRRYEEQYGAGDTGGYTHATWQEVNAAFAERPELEGGQWNEAGGWNEWKIVFDLARQLEASGRYSSDQIRFVVWFVW